MAPLRFRCLSSSGCWCFPPAARCPARDGLPSCENEAGAFDMRLLSMGLRNTSLSPAEASASAAVALVFLGSRFVVPFCLPPAHQLLFVRVTSAVEFVLWPSTLAFFLARASANWFLLRLLAPLLLRLLGLQGFESWAWWGRGAGGGRNTGRRRIRRVGCGGCMPRAGGGGQRAPPRSGAYARQEAPVRALKTHLRCNSSVGTADGNDLAL